MKSNSALQCSFWRRNKLPVILQTEAAECGLACLCMVASYFGHRLDLASLRRRFSVSLKGATLKGVMAMAQGLALQTRPLKLEMENLSHIRTPCLLHWDMNHFIVLKSVTGTHAVIHDPGVGIRRLRLTEFAKHFTGVALEVQPTAEFVRKEEIQNFPLLALMGRVTGLRRGLIQLLLLGLVLQLCALVAPFYMQWVIDEALLAADRDLVTILGCGFLLLVILQAAIGAVRAWITTSLSMDLNFQWFGNVFGHLMKLPLPYFEKRHTGDIVSRFGSIETIQHSLTTQFVEGIIDGILVMGTLVMMLLYSPKLAAIACVAVVLYTLLRLAIFGKLRDATAEQIIHSAKQQTHFVESVRGIQSIRLFGRSEERRASWTNALVEQFNANLRIAKLGVTYQSANTLLFSGERVLVIWLAATLVLDNMLSVGMLFAFISYKDQFSSRMTSLVDKIFELKMLRLHGNRLADIVMTDPEPCTQEFEMGTDAINPSIEFRDVSFRYGDGEPCVIKNLNLLIPAGECIALTGPSGCGKTTLVKLLLGLLEPTEGEILIDGVKLSQMGSANFRSLIGTVMQDDGLFAGSITDNISFFSPTPDSERVQSCAQLAAIHPEIVAMPMGYNTLVGDIGSGLSGGQKQRLLLARALYKGPKILVLDEATSHLDVWNELAVNEAVKTLDLTRILVAHRPETIGMAQRVVILQQGAIAHDYKQNDLEKLSTDSEILTA